MEVSIFLAKAWGAYLVIISLCLLVSKSTLQNLTVSVKDKNTVLAYSFMALAIGILSVLSHNVWVLSWEGLVTILGWSALIKGTLFLAHPEFAVKTLKTFKFQRAGGFIYFYFAGALVIGLYLLYIGFSY